MLKNRIYHIQKEKEGARFAQGRKIAYIKANILNIIVCPLPSKKAKICNKCETWFVKLKVNFFMFKLYLVIVIGKNVFKNITS